MTREQELKLIEIGLNTLLTHMEVEPKVEIRVPNIPPLSVRANKPAMRKKRWTQTEEGRKQISRRMKKFWRDKRNGKAK